jgi:hypothetical protein
MKNKLMLTSALVGSLVAGSSAIAQTSITGSLALNYMGVGQSKDGTTAKSARGMGREAQLNVQNKGKTSISGLDYAAGFSLEFDGNSASTATDATSISNENTYIDFIIGGTTLSFGVDHFQNSHNNLAPTATANMADQLDAQLSVSYTNATGANPKESIGVGIMQATPFGNFSALYVPNNADNGSRDSRFLQDKAGRESAYELGFRGNLGVKGLDVKAFVNRENASTTGALQDPSAKSYGIAYNAGDITVGIDRQHNKKASTENAEYKTTQYGIAYAVNKDLSLSVNKATTKSTLATSTADEQWMQFGVGYNFGPVAAGISYITIDDVGNVATIGDYKVININLSTKF